MLHLYYNGEKYRAMFLFALLVVSVILYNHGMYYTMATVYIGVAGYYIGVKTQGMAKYIPEMFNGEIKSFGWIVDSQDILVHVVTESGLLHFRKFSDGKQPYNVGVAAKGYGNLYYVIPTKYGHRQLIYWLHDKTKVPMHVIEKNVTYGYVNSEGKFISKHK